MECQIAKIVKPHATTDGQGVKLNRIIGSPDLNHLDPFLLLDEFKSDDPNSYIGGFPDHPHRGFETVTYMLQGNMRHKDSVGHEGVIQSGDVQWMTAGSGIIHSEIPEQTDGMMWGFQLWINLPASLKMTQPHYQEIKSDQIPIVTVNEHVSIRVIAGRYDQVTGPVKPGPTQAHYLDVALNANTTYQLAIQKDHVGFIYIYSGDIKVMDQSNQLRTLSSQTLAVLTFGSQLTIHTGHAAKLLVITGMPLHEPIVRAGPFVMNTKKELDQAFKDYGDGNFGQTK